LKVSLKKILFIIVCAELMIFYWAIMDAQQTESVVYRQNNQLTPEVKPTTDTAKAKIPMKKAS